MRDVIKDAIDYANLAEHEHKPRPFTLCLELRDGRTFNVGVSPVATLGGLGGYDYRLMRTDTGEAVFINPEAIVMAHVVWAAAVPAQMTPVSAQTQAQAVPALAAG
jgi:hypothetical protein